MMYKAYMTGGGESSPTFKACLKMNIETRSKCVCACMRICMRGCMCMMNVSAATMNYPH